MTRQGIYITVKYSPLPGGFPKGKPKETPNVEGLYCAVPEQEKESLTIHGGPSFFFAFSKKLSYFSQNFDL